VTDLGTLVSLLDFTSLGDDDTEATVDDLCRRASTPLGPVAAVCVWPRFVARCAENLDGTGIAVAAVANFPSGDDGVEVALLETEKVIQSGGTEVDLVMPYRAWLAGERDVALDMIAAVRAACGSSVVLKVILETGAMGGADRVRDATRDAIEAGADFVKTSTGKIAVNATPEAARAMLEVIAESDRPVGFKASGGIRTVAQARDYTELAAVIMGPVFLAPATFRLGASSLLDAILRESQAD